MKRSRIWLVVLAALATAGLPSAAVAQEEIDDSETVYGYVSSPSMDSLPYLVAIDNMAKEGYNIRLQQLASNDLGLAALATNQTQFWGTGPVEWSRVINQVPVKLVTARANNGWQLVSTADIEDCSQLDGQKVGLFNLTGISTAYPMAYFEQNCPDMEPEIVLIPDSGLRAQAMAAGELVATPLQADDAVKLLDDYPGRFKVLANFAADLPELGRDFIGTNETMLNEHPEIVKEFIKQHLQTIRSFYEDPTTAVAAAEEFLELGGSEQLLTDFYVENQAWCANGGLEDANLATSLEYFGEFELIEPGMSAAVFLAPGPLTEVLDEIGRSDATEC